MDKVYAFLSKVGEFNDSMSKDHPKVYPAVTFLAGALLIWIL